MEGSVEGTDVKVDGLDNRGNVCRFPEADGDSFLFQSVQVKTDPEVHTPSYAIGAGDLFIRVKRPGRERNHSPQFKSRVRESGSVPLLPLIPSWHLQKQLHLYYWGRTLLSAKEAVGKETGQVDIRN